MFTILIVEGSPAFRRSLKEIIGARFPSLAVGEAANAEEAMVGVRSVVPDLVFTEVSFPGENGFALTRQIKRDYPQVRVVILSSHDFDEYRDAAHDSGADHFFAKGSSTWDEMAVLIEKMLLEKEHGGTL